MKSSATLSVPHPSAVSDARVCLTATGILIVEHKVLLIKHKKLGVWLYPGGHLDENELPHQAAEREFWEETGVKVRAISNADLLRAPAGNSRFVPSPIVSNLHWFSYDNYLTRLAGNTQVGSRQCEQHLALAFLMKPASHSLKYRQNTEETDGIGWFSWEDLKDLDTLDSVRSEISRAFELV